MKKELYTKQSDIDGTGVFLRQKTKKGERVGIINGPIVIVRGPFTGKLTKDSLDWIGVGRYSWINTAHSIFRYINHSCDPNTIIKGKRTVYALRDIKPDEEITMDYSLTESDPDWSIDCKCGTKLCRKKIGPIYSLPKSVFKRYEKYISDRFKSVYRVGRVF